MMGMAREALDILKGIAQDLWEMKNQQTELLIEVKNIRQMVDARLRRPQ